MTENITFSEKVRRMLGLDLDSWNNILLLFLAVAAGAGAVVVFATYATVQLAKQEAADSKKEFETYKLTVEGQVADAKKEGIEAGKAAGDAMLKAAELEKQAEQLRKDATEANAVLGIAQADIAKANAETARANEAAALANERAAVLEQSTRNLKYDNQRLLGVVSPRGMTPANSQNFMEYIKRFSGLKTRIESYGLDIESAFLCKKLAAQLKFSGLTIEDKIASLIPEKGYLIGVQISGKNVMIARGIAAALNLADIFAMPNEEPLSPDESVDLVLRVGPKPVNLQ